MVDIVPTGTLVATFLALAAAFLVPGVLLTLGIFPRMAVTQRVALGLALGMALPALVETLAGFYGGVRFTRAFAFALAAAMAAIAITLVLLRPLVLSRRVGAPRTEFTEATPGGAVTFRRAAAPRPAAARPPGARAADVSQHGLLDAFRPWPGTTPLQVALLVAILAGAAFLCYKPHLDYELPFHRDEWTHYDAAAAVERAGGDLRAVDTVYPNTGFARHPEMGYYALLLHAKALTGAAWEPLLLAWPTFVFVGTVLALYAVTAPFGYGLEAAFLGALLPTSIRVLGPQFAVPLALGLFLIPVAYLLFLRAERGRAWVLLALLMAFVYLMHPPSAVAVAFLMAGYALAGWRRHWKVGVALLPLAGVPFVLGAMEAPEKIVDVDEVFAQEVRLPVPDFVELAGPILVGLFLVGTWVVLRDLRSERAGWLATSLAHLVVILVFLQGFGVNALYDRAWMHALLTMSATAAFGLHRLLASLERVAASPGPRRAVFALGVVGILLPAATAQHVREGEFYEVIAPNEFEDFQWIAANVEVGDGRAAVDPWKATAFEAMTGMPTVWKSWQAERPRWLDEAIRNGSLSGTLAAERNIAVVYTSAPLTTEGFREVRGDVFVRERT